MCKVVLTEFAAIFTNFEKYRLLRTIISPYRKQWDKSEKSDFFDLDLENAFLEPKSKIAYTERNLLPCRRLV